MHQIQVVHEPERIQNRQTKPELHQNWIRRNTTSKMSQNQIEQPPEKKPEQNQLKPELKQNEPENN